jgi:PRTRC genetic system protein E
MFMELAELVKTTSLTLLITSAGEDELKVSVIPKPAKEGANPALNTPIIMTATPAELDEKIGGILTKYKASRKSLEETLDAATTFMAAAGKEAQDAATAKAKMSAAPVKTSAPTTTATTGTDTATDASETQTDDEDINLFD